MALSNPCSKSMFTNMSKRKVNNYVLPNTPEYKHMKSSYIKEIKILKMYLMSRSNNKQVLAIKQLVEIMKTNNSTDKVQLLVEADIPGLLCDIINNHNPKLIERVFSCLLELSNSKEFYSQKHSTVVVEATCRTIMILANEGNSASTIQKGLVLLRKILSEYDKELTVNLYQVMEVVTVILESSILHVLHLNAIMLLKIILQTEDFNHKYLPGVIYRALTLTYKLRKNNIHRFNKHIMIALSIMTYSLRYFSLHGDSPLTQKAFSAVWHLVKSAVIPTLKEQYINTCSESIILKQLSCLLAVYNCFDEERLHSLSNLLAAEGYLTLLPELDHRLKIKSIHKYVTILLSHVLARLALSELKLPMEVCQLIGKGLQKLPADSTSWTDFLAETKNPHYIHLTIIIHLYFVLLCDCRASLVSSSQLRALCKHILSREGRVLSPEVKAIAFIFAVLFLSQPQCAGDSYREIAQATRRLTEWIKSAALGKVFTHHPAMMYWFFSGQVSDETLQMHSIALWMKDKSPPSRKELEDLLLKIDGAVLLVVDLLCRCSEKMTMDVMSLLKSISARDSKRRLDISVYIWRNLSTYISCLTTPGYKRLKNMCCIIFLACKVVPHSPNTSLMLRLSQQLVRTFQRICGITWEQTVNNTRHSDVQILLTQMFKLTHAIICKTIMIKDYRGLKMFLEEDSVRRALLVCLDSDNFIVTNPALKLLTYLQHSQRMYTIQIRSKGTLMGAEFLLQLMTTKNADTAFYVANLFCSLRVLDRRMFISLSNDMSSTIIQTLYQEFLNLSVRHSAVSRLSWRCEGLLLKYCSLHNQVTGKKLLYHPLNKIALQVAFKKNGISDTYLLEYLYMYVKGARDHKLVSSCSYSRAIYRDPVLTTLTVAAEQLLTKEWPLNSLHTRLIQLICRVGGNIPINTINVLKCKMSQRYPQKI